MGCITTFRNVFKVSLSRHIQPIMLLVAIVFAMQSGFAGDGPTTNLPFLDDFEGYTNQTPLNTGTNGWYSSDYPVPVVQTDTVSSGTKAALIAMDCTLSNRFTGLYSSNVWIHMNILPPGQYHPPSEPYEMTPYSEVNRPAVDTNQAVLFYINSNGNFVVYDRSVSDWVTATNFDAGTNGTEWVTVSIYADFNMRRWHLYASNSVTALTLVTNNIMFINPSLTNFSGFSLYNGAMTSYVDDVSVIYSNKSAANIVGSFAVSDKVYDGNTAAVITNNNLTLTGVAGDVTLTPVATFDTKDAGTDKIVGLTGSGLTGADAVNYTLDMTGAPTATGDIAKATMTAALVSVTKPYDGTTLATLSPGNFVLTGLIGAEASAVNQTVGTYATVAIGEAIRVTATLADTNFPEGVNGFLTNNYILPTGATTEVGVITSRVLAVKGLTANSRPYDRTFAATVSGTAVLDGVVGAEDVSLTGTPVFVFASSNVGSSVAISITGYGLDGTAKGNYTLAMPSLAADIIKVPLTVSLVPDISKTYDGIVKATLAAANYLITGFVDPETCTINQTVGTYASTYPGTGITVTATLAAGNYTGSGFLVGNYDVPLVAMGDVGTITKMTADVTLSGLTQQYDGTARNVTYSTMPPGLTVSLTYDGNDWAPTNAGSYEVIGTVVNDDLYQGTNTGTLTVNKGDQSIDFAVSAQPYTNGSLTLSATASSGLPVTFALVSGPATNLGATIYFTNVGEVVVSASQGGDANWNAASDVSRSFSVYGSSPVLNTIPWSDDFENYYDLQPLIDGTNGWYADSSSIVVQTNVAKSGTKAAMIPAGTLSNRFMGAETTNVWVQMDVLPAMRETPDYPVVDTNAAMMFFVDTNGYYVVHNGPANPTSTNSTFWMTNYNVKLPTDGTTWVRINILQDFANTNWTLYSDGVMVTNNIGFINTSLTNFNGFDIYNDGPSSYVDNVSVLVADTNNYPPLMVTPLSLSQSLYANATKSVMLNIHTIKVVNAWSTDIGFQVRTNQPWVTAVLAGGATNGVVTGGSTQDVVVSYTNTAMWTVGESNASVTVVATNGIDFWSTQTVQVALNAINISNCLDVAPIQISNTVWRGATPTNRPLVVRNIGDLDFTYSVKTNIFWIASSSNAGTVGAYGTNVLSLTNTASTATWKSGTTSNATVTVWATNGASGVSATQTVSVFVSVADVSNVFLVTPRYIARQAWIGDTPTNQALIVSNMSDVSISYQVKTTAWWIAVSPTSGTCAAQSTNLITLSYKPTWGWGVGISNATAIVSAVSGAGSTQLVVMTLNVSTPPANYYVATNGTDTNWPFSYTNWMTAAKSITSAVYKANFYTNLGSVVWISNGVYNLPSQVTLSNVTVRSVNGATNVMLNGGTFRGFYLAHTGAALNGLTITNCKPTAAFIGGAVFVATGKVWNCRLMRNVATNGGGIAVGAAGEVRNCLIWGNVATNGGGVYYDTGGRRGFVENCTIASNYASLMGGGLFTAASTTGLCANSVTYSNNVRSDVYTNWGTNINAKLMFTNCNVGLPEASFGANSITNMNPLFVNLAVGDCRISSGSPCIDAGSNQVWMVNALDLIGNMRKRFGRVDIGAYEWYMYQGMQLKVNGVRYEDINLINGDEPGIINGITNSSSIR